MEIVEARQRLKVYRALDNEVRLKALKAIADNPGISFNRISRKVEVERGLLAYHLGVLKAAGVVDANYGRRSKETSRYELTQMGKERLQELFPPKAEPKKKTGKGKPRKP